MSPKTYSVSNDAQFKAILAKAKGGDTIALKAGEYDFDVKDVYFDNPLIITSENPDDPAVLTGSTLVHRVSNITFSNLEITPPDPVGNLPNASSKAALFLREASNIVIDQVHVHAYDIAGHNADEDRNLIEGLPYGFGIRVSDSQNVTISNSEISELHKGVGLWNTEDVTIQNNHFHDIRVDGVVGTDQIDTLIAENLFESFRSFRKEEGTVNGYTDDHSDMIQFWGTTASFGIDGFTVKDNVFVQLGTGNQTIFGRLNLRSDDDPDAISFNNFEISGNLIYNSSKRAISLSDVAQAKVFDNTLISTERVLDDFRNVPAILIENSGPNLGDPDFSYTEKNVQRSRDIEVYNNVVTNPFDSKITLKAFDPDFNTMAEVEAELNIKVHSNNSINSRQTSSSNYKDMFKLYAESSSEALNITVDESAAQVHGTVGSKFYTDPAALQDFIANLTSNRAVSVNSDLTSEKKTQKADISAPDVKAASSLVVEEVEQEVEQVVAQRVAQKVTHKIEQVAEVVLGSGPEVVDAPPANSEPATLVKGNGNKFSGTQKAEKYVGISGADFVISLGGDDTIDGAHGNDQIFSGDGDDNVSGGLGRDLIRGGAGEDILYGGNGRDTLMGGADDDILIEDAGNDFLSGSSGFDIVVLKGAPDDYDIQLSKAWDITISNLKTGHLDKVKLVEAIYFQGNDTLYNINRHTGETSYLEPWKDNVLYTKLRELGKSELIQEDEPEKGLTYIGSDANDYILGTIGDDEIDGLKGDDLIAGNDGDDILIGGAGKDRLRGDKGDDFMLGGSGRDVLVGHRGDDLLLGGSGNDFIAGSKGNDIVVGGIGNDRMLGGTGIDTAVYAGSQADYAINHLYAKTFEVVDKTTSESDILVDVERIYFEEENLLGEIRYQGWVRELSEITHAKDYEAFNLSSWTANADEMVY